MSVASPSAPFATKTVRGFTLRTDPAREACFEVVQTDAELRQWPDMSEESRRERLHRHMNNELGSLEIAAQTLADFPEAPWDLRLELARQCWDETRHVAVLYDRLLKVGGRKGEFAITNFEWGITCMLDSLAARLAVQNRTFEAGEMDFLAELPAVWREAGDEETARVIEGILSDEIQHVRFANRWVRRLVEGDRPLLLKVAQALSFLSEVTTAFAPRSGDVNAAGIPTTEIEARPPDINVDDRRRAEFTDEEIAVVLRRAGLGPLVPQGRGREGAR